MVNKWVRPRGKPLVCVNEEAFEKIVKDYNKVETKVKTTKKPVKAKKISKGDD